MRDSRGIRLAVRPGMLAVGLLLQASVPPTEMGWPPPRDRDPAVEVDRAPPEAQRDKA